MSNRDKNRQFKQACKELGITDKNTERLFHEYLNSAEHEDISDNYSYKELIDVGIEFLEYAGVKRKKK